MHDGEAVASNSRLLHPAPSPTAHRIEECPSPLRGEHPPPPQLPPPSRRWRARRWLWFLSLILSISLLVPLAQSQHFDGERGGGQRAGDLQCPGFCGRTVDNDTSSDCKACPWGTAALTHKTCDLCTEPLPAYDWLYLAFMAFLPALIHAFYIHKHKNINNPSWVEVIEHSCCILECAIAGVITVVLFPPTGSFQLHGCGHPTIRAWYSFLYNPVQEFAVTLPCTSEVVYPLYSLPFVYLGSCLVAMLVLRTVLYMTIVRRYHFFRSYYSALFTLPLLALVHALFAGLFYFAFPFLTGLYAIGANAMSLSMLRPANRLHLWKRFMRSSKCMTHLVINSLLLAFSLVSIGERYISLPFPSPLLMVIVPVPPLFFYLTVSLTQPGTAALSNAQGSNFL